MQSPTRRIQIPTLVAALLLGVLAHETNAPRWANTAPLAQYSGLSGPSISVLAESLDAWL